MLAATSKVSPVLSPKSTALSGFKSTFQPISVSKMADLDVTQPTVDPSRYLFEEILTPKEFHAGVKDQKLKMMQDVVDKAQKKADSIGRKKEKDRSRAIKQVKRSSSRSSRSNSLSKSRSRSRDRRSRSRSRDRRSRSRSRKRRSRSHGRRRR